VIQKRSLCIRESESPYLPQSVGLKKAHPESFETEDLDDLDLDRPYLEQILEHGDQRRDKGEEESDTASSEEGDSVPGKAKGQEEDLLKDGDLYAESPSRSSTNSRNSHSKRQSSSHSQANSKVSPPSEPSPTLALPTFPSPQHTNSHRPLRSPPASVAASTFSSSGAGFSSYEEYVAARKKGVLGDQQNPYSVAVGAGQEEENPYSAGYSSSGYGVDEDETGNAAVPTDDEVYVPYSPSPATPATTAAYVPSR
jgi:hypothetical protein